MTGTVAPGDDADSAYDVVVVGGGPAGCAAGVFTARYGLETAVFDRGRSSLRRCGHLENYLGFPAGVDVATMYDLMHDHATEAGCELVADLVESVTRADGDARFRVEPQDGPAVAASRVVAATRYGGEYLRPLCGDAAFETVERDGEARERFDRSYADHDGTTPVEGLYVASPAEAADRQAIVAAGRGARAGLAVVDAARRAEGYPAPVATHYDWVRREAELGDEWQDRDAWRDAVDARAPDDVDLPAERWAELREREIDRRLETYRTDEELERAARRGHERLLDHVDDDRILARAADIRARRDAAEAGE